MLPSTAAEHALGAGAARGPLLFAPRPSPGPSTESRLKLSIAELTEQQARPKPRANPRVAVRAARPRRESNACVRTGPVESVRSSIE